MKQLWTTFIALIATLVLVPRSNGEVSCSEDENDKDEDLIAIIESIYPNITSCEEMAEVGGCDVLLPELIDLLCPRACNRCEALCEDKSFSFMGYDTCEAVANDGLCTKYPFFMAEVCPITCELGCGSPKQECICGTIIERTMPETCTSSNTSLSENATVAPTLAPTLTPTLTPTATPTSDPTSSFREREAGWSKISFSTLGLNIGVIGISLVAAKLANDDLRRSKNETTKTIYAVKRRTPKRPPPNPPAPPKPPPMPPKPPSRDISVQTNMRKDASMQTFTHKDIAMQTEHNMNKKGNNRMTQTDLTRSKEVQTEESTFETKEVQTDETKPQPTPQPTPLPSPLPSPQPSLQSYSPESVEMIELRDMGTSPITSTPQTIPSAATPPPATSRVRQGSPIAADRMGGGHVYDNPKVPVRKTIDRIKFQEYLEKIEKERKRLLKEATREEREENPVALFCEDISPVPLTRPMSAQVEDWHRRRIYREPEATRLQRLAQEGALQVDTVTGSPIDPWILGHGNSGLTPDAAKLAEKASSIKQPYACVVNKRMLRRLKRGMKMILLLVDASTIEVEFLRRTGTRRNRRILGMRTGESIIPGERKIEFYVPPLIGDVEPDTAHDIEGENYISLIDLPKNSDRIKPDMTLKYRSEDGDRYRDVIFGRYSRRGNHAYIKISKKDDVANKVPLQLLYVTRKGLNDVPRPATGNF